MRDLRILLVQTRFAIIGATRNPRVMVFGTVFPVVLLVLFNSIFVSGKDRTTTFAGGRIDAASYFTAGLCAYAIMLQTFTSICVAVTTQRESGQLKRLRATPMAPWTFIASQVLRGLVLVVAMVVALFAIGVIFYGVKLHAAGILGIVVYVVLGTATLATLGLAMTIFTPTPDTASTVGPFVAVILSFISGVFIPVASLPNWLESVGKVFPLYHLAEGLQLAVRSGGGTGLTSGNVLVLVAWIVVGLTLAVPRFRWEPQTARG
jgi:ABC-2 type transport system permease protein